MRMMVNVFWIIGFKLLLSLSLSFPLHAVMSEAFDMREGINISKSIAYKGKLEVPYSQLENWTDKTINFTLDYITPDLLYQSLGRITTERITIPAHSLVIFTVGDPRVKYYSLSSIILNNSLIMDFNYQGQKSVKHINFFSNGPTRFSDAISTYNINISPTSNQPQ